MNAAFQSNRRMMGAIAGFLALAALGWWLGGLDAGSNHPTESASPGDRTATRERELKPHGGPPSAMQAALQAIRNETMPGERLRAAIQLANTLPVADIAEWIDGRWFDVRGGPELMVFQNILTVRWQHEDPAACAAWAMTHNPDLARTTLNFWAARDPRAVLAFFQAHPNDRLELRTMATITAVDPKLVLARLREMLARGVAPEIGRPNSTENLLRELAMIAPAQLTAVLDSLPPTERKQAESALVGQRLTTDFAGEFSRLIAQPDGLQLFRDNYRQAEGSADQLLARLSELPPEWREFIASEPNLLVDWDHPERFWQSDLVVAGLSAGQDKELRTKALTWLARVQPRKALEWLDDLELSPAERHAVIAESVRFGGKSQAEQTALIALMKTDEDRQAATKALAAPAFPYSIIEIPTPDEWLTKVTTADPTQPTSYRLKSGLANMTREQQADLRSRFQTLPDEQKLQVARMISGNIGSDVEPTLKGEAIRLLAAQAGNTKAAQANLKLAAEHASDWARSDPTAASEWTRTLPPGEPKLWAMRNLAATWAGYDPAGARQWVNSLPSADRDAVVKFLPTNH